jgi:spore cortex formation protein SpoVR/YcgB (stage V sporulation)
MSDWSLDNLQEWDDRICEIARAHGLDWYPITYETCDYFEMIGNMAYHRTTVTGLTVSLLKFNINGTNWV